MISMDMRVHCKNTTEPVADPGFPLVLGQKPTIYRPKVMFSQVFVCPQRGLSRGSLSGGICPGGICLVRSLSGGVLCLEGSLSMVVSVQGSLCPGGSLSERPPLR